MRRLRFKLNFALVATIIFSLFILPSYGVTDKVKPVVISVEECNAGKQIYLSYSKGVLYSKSKSITLAKDEVFRVIITSDKKAKLEIVGMGISKTIKVGSSAICSSYPTAGSFYIRVDLKHGSKIKVK